jgi:hypothetical protein
MKKIEESSADRYVRLLRKKHIEITESPEKSKQFLINIGLLGTSLVKKGRVNVKS